MFVVNHCRLIVGIEVVLISVLILSICTSIGTRANAPIPETDTFRFGSFICAIPPMTDEMYTKECRQSLVVKERGRRVINNQ